MQTTENLGLNLPEYGEFAEVEKLNENFMKIDSEVGGLANNPIFTETLENTEILLNENVSEIPVFSLPESTEMMAEYKDEIHFLGLGSNYKGHYKWNGSELTKVGDTPIEVRSYCTVVATPKEIHIFKETSHYKWDGSSWTTLDVANPCNCFMCKAVFYDGFIYLFSNTCFYKWDVSASKWEEGSTSLPEGLYSIDSILENGYINIFSVQGGKFYVYDPYNDTWEMHPFTKGNASFATTLGRYIHIFVNDYTLEKTCHYAVSSSGMVDKCGVSPKWMDSLSALNMVFSFNGNMYMLLGRDVHLFNWDSQSSAIGLLKEQVTDLQNSVDVIRDSLISKTSFISKTMSALPFSTYPPDIKTVVVNEKGDNVLYLINTETSYMYRYNTSGHTWRKVSGTLPFSPACTVAYNGEIHILGSSSSSYNTKHYKYDAVNSKWISVSTLPYAFADGCAVIYENKIHILGSSVSGNYTKHYTWNGSSWSNESTLPYNFYGGGAVVFNDKISILGGNYSGTNTKFYEYGGSWNEHDSLPYSWYSSSAFVLDDGIHMMGSDDESHYERMVAHCLWNNGTGWTKLDNLSVGSFCGKVEVFDNKVHIFRMGSDGNLKHEALEGKSLDYLYSTLAELLYKVMQLS